MVKPVGLVEGPPGPTVLETKRQPFPVPLSCGTRLPTPLVFLRRSRIKVPPPPPLPCGGGTGAREPPPFPRPLSCGRGGRRARFGGCFSGRSVGRVPSWVRFSARGEHLFWYRRQGAGSALFGTPVPASSRAVCGFRGFGVCGISSDRLFLHKALSAWDFDTPCASFGCLRLTFRAPRNPSGPSF